MTIPNASSCTVTRLLTPSFSLYRFVIFRTSWGGIYLPLSAQTANKLLAGPSCDAVYNLVDSKKTLTLEFLISGTPFQSRCWPFVFLDSSWEIILASVSTSDSLVWRRVGSDCCFSFKFDCHGHQMTVTPASCSCSEQSWLNLSSCWFDHCVLNSARCSELVQNRCLKLATLRCSPYDSSETCQSLQAVTLSHSKKGSSTILNTSLASPSVKIASTSRL